MQHRSVGQPLLRSTFSTFFVFAVMFHLSQPNVIFGSPHGTAGLLLYSISSSVHEKFVYMIRLSEPSELNGG